MTVIHFFVVFIISIFVEETIKKSFLESRLMYFCLKKCQIFVCYLSTRFGNTVFFLLLCVAVHFFTSQDLYYHTRPVAFWVTSVC